MIFEKFGGAVDWLIVGLGNPGQKYEHTRHNMGFLTVDLLAEQLNVKLNKVKFKSAYNIVRFGGQKCLVMKPQTYMNLSGEAVHEAVQFYKIPADHVLVIYDDVSISWLLPGIERQMSRCLMATLKLASLDILSEIVIINGLRHPIR